MSWNCAFSVFLKLSNQIFDPDSSVRPSTLLKRVNVNTSHSQNNYHLSPLQWATCSHLFYKSISSVKTIAEMERTPQY